MVAKVDADECTGCASCIDECAQEAISLNDEDIAIVNDDCTDCGLCVDACPTGAISLD